MARVKKSRKVGKIGITKTESPKKPSKPQLGKSTNTSGNKAGTRQQVANNDTSKGKSKDKQDPRIGSKKSIDLSKYKNTKQTLSETEVKTRTLSPQQELDAIEQDSRLEQLLEKQELSKLSSTEQAYLDKTLKRHKQLCEMLGIDTAEEESDSDTDPFSQLDAIRLDDFKD
jgi:ribosome assembly protein YihI (activator of Der GTPase)